MKKVILCNFNTIEDAEFLSLKFIPSSDVLTLIRDVKKVLTTKNIYVGENQSIQLNPVEHVVAIYMGIKSEKLSRNIELCIE